MRIILFIIGLLVHSSGWAQTGLPPVYEINKDTTYYAIDTAHFQLLEDLTGKLTIDQISQPQFSGKFYYDSFKNLDRNAPVYWLRMRVRNNLSKPARLLYNDFNSDYFDLYTRTENSHWLHQQTGYLRPRSQTTMHNGVQERGRLSVVLQPGQTTTVYHRSEAVFWHPKLSYLAPRLTTEESRVNSAFQVFQTTGWRNHLFDGLMLGVLLLAAVSNILLFVSIRDRTYLYFGICLLFFGLDRYKYTMQRAFFLEYPYAFELAAFFFFILYYIFFIQSLRSFIRPVAALKTLNQLTTLALWMTVILNITQFLTIGNAQFPSRFLNQLVEVAIRIVYLFVFIMNVRMLRQGTVLARYSLVATLPLFGYWLTTLASVFYHDVTGDDWFPVHPDLLPLLENACFAWLIIFFSGALVGRYNQVSKQVSQQALEREQLEREQDLERTRLIADQNERLERQVAERTAELQTSLDNLKATQAQLIQSEKMASLGELTAGIAHEIQNPLNFVNNFADVSAELVDELEDEQQKPTRDPDLETDLLTDLKQNLQRISQHGNRASSIVRGMLEHSRATTGEKLPTDLNALCDEYLRLAYHGLRAKNKNFNCELVTHFNADLDQVAVVPQDIGRVVLNLVNNAFYAVSERQRVEPATYQPTVTVTTKGLVSPKRAEIYIQDNGTGMSESVSQKIFQPFYTTKPSGSGTGLGLSLSYDIIVKGHGGSLTVASREGEGTAFIITLPVG
ncbi:MAG: histidine kinase [Bacteroidetes bacterium]|nr:histidine kinase [Fibrella sp.]